MRRLMVLMGIVLMANVSFAQAPVVRQFFFNPYLLNPSYVGYSEKTELTLAHRQQWVGFQDAPKTSVVAFQLPLKKVSLGVTLVSNEAASLQRSTAVFTFGYKVKINDNHSLRFGISGGAGYSKLDLGDADYSNDPSVLNAAANQFYASGNFGMVYIVKGWQLGFALPEIIGQSYIDHQNDYRQLRRQRYSLSYRKFNSEGISINPYFIFTTNLLSQNSWEGATMMYYKEKIWTGVSYHQYSGLGFFFGLKMLEGLQFSYNYELPPVSQSFVNTASHEFQLKLIPGLFRAKDRPRTESLSQ